MSKNKQPKKKPTEPEIDTPETEPETDQQEIESDDEPGFVESDTITHPAHKLTNN